MIRLLSATLVVVVGCSSDSPELAAPGNRLSISVSPLSLEAVTEAIYRLRVLNGDNDLVWTADVSSSRYGDGRGAISYVGPCDASSNENTVELELLDLRDDSDSIPFVNPTANGPLRQSARCAPNRDVAITFELTIMRPANQGFFDIAVEFDDIFCSAKVDCTRADGQPNLLLFDPDTGDRVPTAVIAAACSAGADTDTYLYLDTLVLDCGAAGIHPVPSAPPLGNAFAANPVGPLMQVATYAGVESLTTGTPPRPASKVYYNTAIALDPGSPATGRCSLSGSFTAHDGPLTGYSTADLGVYPVIRIAIPDFATSAGLVCGLNPLDAPNAPAGTGIFSDYSSTSGDTFTLEVRKNTLGDLVLTPSGAVPPTCDPIPGCNGTITCEVPSASVCSECEPGRFGARCTPCAAIEGCEVTVLCSDATDATCADCADGLVGPQCTPTLGLSAPASRAFVRDTVQLARTGGAAPFVYEVTAGVATVDSSGLLTIGDVEGTVTVTVSDASGQSASVTLTVVRGCGPGTVDVYGDGSVCACADCPATIYYTSFAQDLVPFGTVDSNGSLSPVGTGLDFTGQQNPEVSLQPAPDGTLYAFNLGGLFGMGSPTVATWGRVDVSSGILEVVGNLGEYLMIPRGFGGIGEPNLVFEGVDRLTAFGFGHDWNKRYLELDLDTGTATPIISGLDFNVDSIATGPDGTHYYTSYPDWFGTVDATGATSQTAGLGLPDGGNPTVRLLFGPDGTLYAFNVGGLAGFSPTLASWGVVEPATGAFTAVGNLAEHFAIPIGLGHTKEPLFWFDALGRLHATGKTSSFETRHLQLDPATGAATLLTPNQDLMVRLVAVR